MKQQTLGFIGAGNMASSLIAGLLADGYSPENIWASDVDPNALERLSSRFGIHTTKDNQSVVEHAKIVLLAVKPQILKNAALDIADSVKRFKPLIISIEAGVNEKAIDTWLGGGNDIVRCMPNTPALVKTGATALHANSNTSTEQKNSAEAILRSVGLTVWVENESLLDAVTALSGSGPAYFFMMMEAMESAAISFGLETDVARVLCQQTALGAARLAIESDESPKELRRKVTSPGGTTEKAIAAFESAGFNDLVLQAMSAALERSVSLSKELGEDL